MRRTTTAGWLVLVGAAGLVLLIGCQATSAPATPVALSGPAVEGKQLFVTKGCVACHRAPGVAEAQGTIGPNLRGIGNASSHPKIAAVVDNTPQNMKRWIMSPQSVKPGTSMPSTGLTDDEAAKIVAFLEALQ